MPHTQFNFEEAAEYLHVSEEDLKDLVKFREIPHHHRGGTLVFFRGEIDSWASCRILALGEKKLTTYHKRSSANVHDFSQRHALVPELMKPHFIEPAFPARTRGSVIKNLVALSDSTSLLNYPAELQQSLEEREEMISTAMPGGVALLHPRNHDPYMFEDSHIVLARSLGGIPFGSPDGFKTDIFFLICCQDDKLHLHILARISMMCLHTLLLDHLRTCETREEMMEALVESEERIINQKF